MAYEIDLVDFASTFASKTMRVDIHPAVHLWLLDMLEASFAGDAAEVARLADLVRKDFTTSLKN